MTCSGSIVSCFYSLQHLLQIDGMDLLTKGVTVTSFIIYNWIEQPHKQEVLKETMDLLVQKVIDPYTGRQSIQTR